MTAAPLLTFIPDIVAEHYDELQFLWGQRRRALRSLAYTERELGMLDERIEGHVEGLLVIGQQLLEFVEPALAGDEELPAFAAALALLRLGTPDALRRVIDVVQHASGPKLGGLRDALAHGPAAPLAPQLQSLFLTAAPPLGAAAGEALAFQGALAPVARQLERFIRADEPQARAGGWRIAAYCAVAAPTEWLVRALADDDPVVKEAAITAAAWSGSPAFFAHCRDLAAEPKPDAIPTLSMFAAVAAPEDYQRIGAVGTNPAAGPDRLRVVGTFAHPYFIELLMYEMANADPAVAVAAGAAFEKMTGRSAESERRAKIFRDGKPPADDFEAEFLDEVLLPDQGIARKHWEELAPRLAHATRICRGMDVSQLLTREQFGALDMESRREHSLRARLFSGWQGTPLVLERYPQRF
jgi:uncharacterized protein (TIGR02270 family)